MWAGAFDSFTDLSDLGAEGTGAMVYFAFGPLATLRAGDQKNEPLRLSLLPRSDVWAVEARVQPVFLVTKYSASVNKIENEIDINIHLARNPNTVCDNWNDISDVQVVVGHCESTPITVTRAADAGDGNEAFFDFILPRAKISDCSSSFETDPVTGVLIQKFGLKFSTDGLPSECLAKTPAVPVGHELYNFTLRSAVGINGQEEYAEVETTVNGGLIVRATDYSMVACNDRVTPMGKLELFTETRSANLVASKSYGPASIDKGAVMLDRDETYHSCSVDGDELVCIDRFVSQNCIEVNNNAQADECAFTYIGEINVPVTYYLDDGRVASGNIQDPTLPSVTFQNDTCPVLAVQEDVTALYPVTLSFVEDGTNKLDNFVIELDFDEFGDDSTLTLQIENVQVTIGDVTRTYDINDKLSLMGMKGSTYYNDVHFCRRTTVGGDGSVCSAFYDAAQPSRRNDFTLANPLMYHIRNQGHKNCQSVQKRGTDRWSFNPRQTGFTDLLRTVSNEVKVRVSATVKSCATPVDIDGNSRRLLQEGSSGDKGIVVTSASIVIKPESGKTVVETDGGDGEVEEGVNTGLLFGVSIASGVLFAALFYLMCVKRDPKEEEKNELDGELEVEKNELDL